MIEIAKPSLGIIAGVAALTVFIELILWRRRMLLSARVGLCPTCDYDLRGSTDRCPECGTAIKVATK